MSRHKHHDHSDDHDDSDVRRELAPPSSDMNVTPLIDVLLVLLVIFMATLPLTQSGTDINLPLEVQAKSVPKESTQIVAEYTADHKLTINRQVVAIENVQARLRDMLETRKDKTLFVIGDASVRYGEVMAIVDAAIGAGARIAIVTDGMKAEVAAGKGK